MKPSVHLLDPVNGSRMHPYLTMRCGLKRHETKDNFISTTKPEEVTCIKCRSYINNPYRVLRKYGKIKVVESGFVVLWAQYGYQLDFVATYLAAGNWTLCISEQNTIYDRRTIFVSNMAALGFKLLEIYEKMIIEKMKP